MIRALINYVKGLGLDAGWMKMEADAARNTYLKRAARNTKGSRRKKPNRLHVSRKTKRRHKRRA